MDWDVVIVVVIHAVMIHVVGYKIHFLSINLSQNLCVFHRRFEWFITETVHGLPSALSFKVDENIADDWNIMFDHFDRCDISKLFVEVLFRSQNLQHFRSCRILVKLIFWPHLWRFLTPLKFWILDSVLQFLFSVILKNLSVVFAQAPSAHWVILFWNFWRINFFSVGTMAGLPAECVLYCDVYSFWSFDFSFICSESHYLIPVIWVLCEDALRSCYVRKLVFQHFNQAITGQERSA